MAFSLLIRVEAAPGADLTADPSTWPWIDISAKARGSVSIRRGREDTYSVVGPSTCTLRLDNVDSRFTPYHPAGAYWPNWRRGTPIRVSVNPGSGWYTRFTGEMRECDPVWPSGNSDVAEVQVIAKGILQRLGQGRMADSPVRQVLLNDPSKPVAYWSMEDESGAGSFGSAVGGPAMTFTGFTPAADSTILGSLPLPKAGNNASFVGTVEPYPAASVWAMAWVMIIPSAPTTKTPLLTWYTPTGSIQRWVLSLSPPLGVNNSLITLQGFDASGTNAVPSGITFGISAGTSTDQYGVPLFFRISASQSGPNIVLSVDCSIAQSGSGIHPLPFAGTVGNVTQVSHSAQPGLTAGGHVIGHFAIGTDVNYANRWAVFPGVVLGGYNNERTSDRFARLCDGATIPRGGITPHVGEAMGPQQRSTLLDLLRQVEATEAGLIWESVAGRLMWRVNTGRTNRTPTLALDCDKGHVKLPFAPIEDDQRLRNDVSVSRIGGGTATYTDIDVRDGAYPTPLNLNYVDDSRLLYRAQWETHVGTVAEMRIPGLPINLQGSPDLISQWLNSDIGDWLTVDHLPAQYPPGQAGCVLEGYTETFDAATWSASLDVSASRPWEVFQVEDSRRGRLDTAGSQLTAGVSAGATSLSVQTLSGPLWTTLPSDFPMDVEVNGWQVTVTSISGSSSPQTFTVNPVPAALPVNATVKLWRPGAIAL